VQLLVEAGADIFVDDKTQDAWGSKAIDDARTMGHPNVVEFLQPLMAKVRGCSRHAEMADGDEMPCESRSACLLNYFPKASQSGFVYAVS
jgi:hypothetical protein